MWERIQSNVFSFLEEELGELTAKQQKLASVLWLFRQEVFAALSFWIVKDYIRNSRYIRNRPLRLSACFFTALPDTSLFPEISMNPLSLAPQQFSANSLFSGMSGTTSASSFGSTVWDSIAEQQMTLSLSRSGVTGGLDGIYSAKGTILQSSPNTSQNLYTPAAVSAGMNQQIPSVQALTFDSAQDGNDQTALLLAINRASFNDIGSLFGGQNSSLGNFLDLLA